MALLSDSDDRMTTWANDLIDGADLVAWYLALAERLEVALVTLDRRLARTADARCEFTFPPH